MTPDAEPNSNAFKLRQTAVELKSPIIIYPGFEISL